jgi:saccharopine dehydrogenase-like NADP-dependent oxidoreductase
MRIVVSGKDKGRARTFTYDLYDRRDKATGYSSMARTTGFPATAAAHLILDGRFTRKGICPPEFIGESEADFRYVMAYLEERGVHYRVKS